MDVDPGQRREYECQRGCRSIVEYQPHGTDDVSGGVDQVGCHRGVILNSHLECGFQPFAKRLGDAVKR